MSHPLRKTLLVVALCAAAGAQAQSMYFGGALTAPDWRDSVNGYGDGDGGGNGPGLKLYGGWQYTPNLGLEAGLFNLGRSHDASTGGSVKGWGGYVDGIARVEFAPGWWALGSAGLAAARLKTPVGSDSAPGLKLGLGVQYDVARNTSVRLGYDHYRFSSAFGDKANVGQTTLGVNVGF